MMMNHVCMGAFAAVVMMAQSAAAEPVGRAEKRQARDALELFYLDRGIYDPVRCEVEDGGEPERTWAFCTAVGGDGSIGGLYTVGPSDGGGIEVFAVNGKALQHIGKAPIQIEDIRQQPIMAKPWQGNLMDIPAALSLFD